MEISPHITVIGGRTNQGSKTLPGNIGRML
jgi:hypothetical protein